MQQFGIMGGWIWGDFSSKRRFGGTRSPPPLTKSTRASGRCPEPRLMPSSSQRDLAPARPLSRGSSAPIDPAHHHPVDNYVFMLSAVWAI